MATATNGLERVTTCVSVRIGHASRPDRFIRVLCNLRKMHAIQESQNDSREDAGGHYTVYHITLCRHAQG